MEVWAHIASLTPPLSIEVSVLSQESEHSCIYMCVRGINFDDFFIWFWNSSDSVLFFFFILLSHNYIPQISLLNLLDIVDNKKHNTYVQISRNVRPVYELSNLWKSRYLGKWDSDGCFFCLMSSKHYYSYIIVLFLVHEVVSIIIAILLFYSWYMKLWALL